MSGDDLFGAGFLAPKPESFGARPSVRPYVPRRGRIGTTWAVARTTAISAALTFMLSASDARATQPQLIVRSESIAPGFADRNRWSSYLAEMASDADEEFRANARFARAFVDHVWSIAPELPPPQAGPTGEGAFQLVWDAGRHHVEAELHDGVFDWFYRDRTTNAFEAGEDYRLNSFPARLRTVLLACEELS